MENHVKMLITEQAAEFHREDAKILNDYSLLPKGWYPGIKRDQRSES